jgi:hypothetical protein
MGLLNYLPLNQPKMFKRVSIINGIGNRRVHMQSSPQTVNRPPLTFLPRTTDHGTREKAMLDHEWKERGNLTSTSGHLYIYTQQNEPYITCENASLANRRHFLSL